MKKPAKPKAKKVVAKASPKKEPARHSAAAHPSPGKAEAKKPATAFATNAVQPKASATVPKPSAGQN